MFKLQRLWGEQFKSSGEKEKNISFQIFLDENKSSGFHHSNAEKQNGVHSRAIRHVWLLMVVTNAEEKKEEANAQNERERENVLSMLDGWQRGKDENARVIVLLHSVRARLCI